MQVPRGMTARQKILIVEDNADLRRLYAIGLNQHGYEVRLAGNGAEALDRIESERPDVILLDLLMPIMDGWEVISRVNGVDSASQIPIVVITGQTVSPDHPMHPSIHGWLTKPASIEQLVGAIEHLGPEGQMAPPAGPAPSPQQHL